ncbi:Spermidine export protein mdtI [Klebsiella pneumoniae]|uniref:Spermidine export protein mdtI n=1 Tax=Klebsiella pneumoniae TaxID=573 RepID=A0A377X7L8_KLEPN|nr:Spermidine export protein mdtI [Klebsiella pneumoniae]
MQQFEWIHAAWLAIAIVLEIIANVFLKFSDGLPPQDLRHPVPGGSIGRVQRPVAGG